LSAVDSRIVSRNSRASRHTWITQLSRCETSLALSRANGLPILAFIRIARIIDRSSMAPRKQLAGLATQRYRLATTGDMYDALFADPLQTARQKLSSTIRLAPASANPGRGLLGSRIISCFRPGSVSNDHKAIAEEHQISTTFGESQVARLLFACTPRAGRAESIVVGAPSDIARR